jgi:hypothetical protein
MFKKAINFSVYHQKPIKINTGFTILAKCVRNLRINARKMYNWVIKKMRSITEKQKRNGLVDSKSERYKFSQNGSINLGQF